MFSVCKCVCACSCTNLTQEFLSKPPLFKVIILFQKFTPFSLCVCVSARCLPADLHGVLSFSIIPSHFFWWAQTSLWGMEGSLAIISSSFYLWPNLLLAAYDIKKKRLVHTFRRVLGFPLAALFSRQKSAVNEAYPMRSADRYLSRSEELPAPQAHT